MPVSNILKLAGLLLDLITAMAKVAPAMKRTHSAARAGKKILPAVTAAAMLADHVAKSRRKKRQPPKRALKSRKRNA